MSALAVIVGAIAACALGAYLLIHKLDDDKPEDDDDQY